MQSHPPDQTPRLIPDYASASAGPPKKRISPGAIVVIAVASFLLLGFLMALFHGVVRRPYVYTFKERSAENLAQIHSACISYMNSYNGEYPDSFGTMIRVTGYPPDILVSGLGTETCATRPSTDFSDAELVGHCSYVYCGNGLNSSSPASEPVAYESLANYQGAGTQVLYADHSVKWLNKVEVELMSRQLRSRTKPAATQPAPALKMSP